MHIALLVMSESDLSHVKVDTGVNLYQIFFACLKNDSTCR